MKLSEEERAARREYYARNLLLAALNYLLEHGEELV